MRCSSPKCGLDLLSFRNHLGTYTVYCESCDYNDWNKRR